MKPTKKLFSRIPGGVVTLAVFVLLFGYLGSKMGAANMLNTIMNTSHDLLLNTVFYLMAICVITGAIGKIFVEFGVVKLLEKLLRPLMKPLFNLPGVASLGAVLTFLSDNPAIISLAQDKRFATYFKKYQFISLTNFGTAFGMGLLVIVFMMGQGYFIEPFVGLFGAFIGCIVSTRLMQRFVIKAYPKFKDELAVTETVAVEEKEDNYKKPLFQRILDSLLDGGRSGVDVGLAIIPGVLIISTLVMVFTYGPDKVTGEYTGEIKQGVDLLPLIGRKLSLVFDWLFGFAVPYLIAFPITALGSVGAALSLVPNFSAEGWIDGNAIAVFTAIGMCWSGYLSTHTAMLDALGYRRLTSKAILAHTVGGFVAGVVAHWVYMLVSLLFFSSAPVEQVVTLENEKAVTCEWVSGSSEWTPVETDSLQKKMIKRNIVYKTIDLSVDEPGVISVNFKNNKGAERLNVLGVDIVDVEGNGLSACYSSKVTDETYGCAFTLNDVPGGNCKLRYFVKRNEALNTSSGALTLKLQSHDVVLDSLLKQVRPLCDVKAGTKEQVMLVALLRLMCDKYEAMLADPNTTVEEFEAACDELVKVVE